VTGLGQALAKAATPGTPKAEVFKKERRGVFFMIVVLRLRN
jgi:hypothetical protein